jgi:hypothetical protein
VTAAIAAVPDVASAAVLVAIEIFGAAAAREVSELWLSELPVLEQLK